jgi:hypothetical protein
MNVPRLRWIPAPLRRYALLLATAPLLSGQLAPNPAPDAATLARFDSDKNGRLDPEEVRGMEAETRRLAPSGLNGANAPDELITMSPFEVTADAKGYYASNTMSGTRLNSKIEDLASSISVVTKDQMADFAMLDINDVFLYANNTEGTGTFTDFALDDGQGALTDATSGDPGNANRVRGIGRANVSIGNFESSNRVPLDPIDADAIEVSRGPNANIFGLGNPSGTVNVVASSANVIRHRSGVGVRGDSFGGNRYSADFNRVLVRGRAAVRVSAVKQYDGYQLKPSGVNSRRYNAMVQLRPFKSTTINASYQVYRTGGNRPNSTPPMDGFTNWIAGGRQTWDPVTNTRHFNGASLGSSVPGYMYAASGNYPALYVEPDGSVPVFITNYGTTTTAGRAPSPLNDATNSARRMFLTRADTSTQPLIKQRVDMLSDKTYYDWQKFNWAAPNRFQDRTETARITLDQVFFNTGQQSLAGQFGFFREDSQRYQRYFISDGTTAGPTGQMVVDVNERLLDGRPNPGFLRPLIQVAVPGYRNQPIRNKTYRGQLAYQVNFTTNKGWTRWLGAHGLTGYDEYKEKISRYYRFYDQVISPNSWLVSANGDIATHTRVRPAVRWYIGDAQGTNMDYAPGSYSYGDYEFTWGDATLPANMNHEKVTLGSIAGSTATGSLTVQKTRGAILQSRLLEDRVVTTFGRRKDQSSTKTYNTIYRTNHNLDYDYAAIERFNGDWMSRDGSTEQRGVVLRPFRGWAAIDGYASRSSGIGRLVTNALRNLSVHYNESDSFLPTDPARTVYGEWLPDPSGFGKDYGFALNLFDGKLMIRVNKYRTEQINSRNGPSGTFAKRVWNIDYSDQNVGLQVQAEDWITELARAQGRTLSPSDLNAELLKVMKTEPRNLSELNAIGVSETDNMLSTGHEVELHFNPTSFWTVAASMNEKQTINTKLAKSIAKYVAERLPVWQTIVDPRTGQLWWQSHYNNYSETPEAYYIRQVGDPLKIATALEGLSRPQIRRYSGNLSTNFRLSGITRQPLLKKFNVGGALRYESKGAIGYWGLQQPPAVMTEYDYHRPIYDKSHLYGDLLVGYRTRLYSDRIATTFQLNIRNIQENGRLQPVGAGPEGKLTAFRIVSPRQFILSANFDL